MTPVALREATDEAVFGGKAAQIGTGIRAGLPIPGGIALPTGFVAAVAVADAAAMARPRPGADRRDPLMPRLPQLTLRELIRFLKSRGFVEGRQRGSHLTLWHEGRRVAVTIPVHTGTDIGRGLATRTLEDAGFSVADCLRFR
jgi:predicted RNA binding protein YcfA (HicA-like mRNA interferase family)